MLGKFLSAKETNTNKRLSVPPYFRLYWSLYEFVVVVCLFTYLFYKKRFGADRKGDVNILLNLFSFKRNIITSGSRCCPPSADRHQPNWGTASKDTTLRWLI